MKNIMKPRPWDGILAIFVLCIPLLVFFLTMDRFSGQMLLIERAEEIVRALMVWLVFLGLPVALAEMGCRGNDILIRHLPPAGRLACGLLVHVVILACAILFLMGYSTTYRDDPGKEWFLNGGLAGMAGMSFLSIVIVGRMVWMVCTMAHSCRKEPS